MARVRGPRREWKMFGLERTLGARLVTYAGDLVNPVQKGQRRRSLAAAARDHGQAEADSERGEDTDLYGPSKKSIKRVVDIGEPG